MDRFLARSPRGAEQTRRMTREATAKSEREKYLAMSLEEKRSFYKCGDGYVTLSSIPTWEEMAKSVNTIDEERTSKYKANAKLNSKVSIWRGDITKLEIDAIANAANASLLGGGGVDGAIHQASGTSLKAECQTLGGCHTGDAKITGGYKLPSRYIMHTVGPIGENEKKLRSCYTSCLKLLKENNLKSLATPCISTGIYGYPNLPAAHVALETARRWLETGNNAENTERLLFCLFLPVDVKIYEGLMHVYFPLENDNDGEELEKAGSDVSGTATPGDKGDTPDSPKVKENAEAPTNPDDGDDNVTPPASPSEKKLPPQAPDS